MKSFWSAGLRVSVMAALLFAMASVAGAQVTTTIRPNPVNVTAGGASQTVTVQSTTPGPSTTNPVVINYSFSGFPSVIVLTPATGSAAESSLGTGIYPPASFQFSASAGVTGGSYAGMLNQQNCFMGGSCFPAGSQPFTVNVIQPDINATFAQNTVNVCNNGNAVADSVTLQPVNGYQGSPTLQFTAPAGILINPQTTTAGPFGPTSSTTVPFTVQAAGAMPGLNRVTLNVSDPSAGINNNYSLMVNVVDPDFTPTVTPATNTLTAGGAAQTFSTSLTPNSCFSEAVSVTASTTDPSITFTPSGGTLAPPYFPLNFSVAAASSTPAGTYVVTFVFTPASGAPVRTVTRTLIVLPAPPPDFTLTVTPSFLTVAAGQIATVSVSATGINGFTGPITVTTTTGTGLTATPSTFTITPGSSQQVSIAVSSSAPVGTQTLSFSGTAPGVSGTRTARFQVVVTVAPDFRLTVEPTAVSVPAGGSTSVTVTAIGMNGFNGPISVTSLPLAGVTVNPASFTLVPGQSQVVTINAPSNSILGVQRLTFVGNATGISGARTVDVSVTVTPRAPVITSIDPPSVTTGVRSAVIHVRGTGFAPGAVITSRTAGVIVESTRVLSPTSAEIVVSVPPNVIPGPYVFILTNPNGGVTRDGATLLVYPTDSLGAPIGVTAAAIVFPRPGTLVAADEALYPRGLLATTGTGTVTGEWRLDGVAFDLFTATVAGGMPTEVRTHVPIPLRLAGSYSLELVVQTPQRALSPKVLIIHSVATASRLKLSAPRDGAVIGTGMNTSPTFRWSLVPGTSGYEVEIYESDPRAARRIRLSDAEWTPTLVGLREIGAGIHRWRVRAIFPGEVPGEPTESRRFAVLPERTSVVLERPLASSMGAMRVQWSGGTPGLLYRIDLFEPGAVKPLASALSSKNEYLIAPFLARRVAGGTVRVTALGPGGIVLGVSSLQQLPPSSSSLRLDRSEIVLAQNVAQPAVVRQEPSANSTVTTDSPRILAEWNGAAATETVSLILDTTDVTAVSIITPTSVTYDALLPLAAGPHTVSVAAGSATSSWTFSVDLSSASAAQPIAGSGAATPELSAGTAIAPMESGATPKPVPPRSSTVRTEWALTPIGTITTNSGSGQNSAALQLSSQSDVDNMSLFTKVTGDGSFRYGFDDPRKAVQESRNFLGQLGGRQKGLGGQSGTFLEQATIGYSVPEFLDQAQLTTLGLARGGTVAKAATPLGIASFYRSFDSAPGGVVTGNFSPKQDVTAYAFEAPWDPSRFLLRVIGLKVNEDPGIYSSGGRGKSFGLLGKFTFGPLLNLIFEGARGDFSPNFGGTEVRKEGNAFRLGLTGMKGTLGYQLNLRRTDATFVNPANRGFTPGGVSDRQGGDLSITKLLGKTALAFGVRHLNGGNTSGSTNPHSSEDGGNISLNRSFGQIFDVSGSANYTRDKADVDDLHTLPATDRNVGGVQINFNERPGRISFGQTLQYQTTNDKINPSGDSTIKGGTLTANGALVPNFNLSAMAAATRSDGSSTSGQTDQLVLSLQPSYMIPRYAVSVIPVVSYSRSKNDLFNSDSKTRTFAPVIMWAPQWIGNLFTLQASANWSKSETKGQPSPHMDPTYGANLSLRWGLKRPSAPDVSPTALPGATPIAPPVAGSSNPVQTSTTPDSTTTSSTPPPPAPMGN